MCKILGAIMAMLLVGIYGIVDESFFLGLCILLAGFMAGNTTE